MYSFSQSSKGQFWLANQDSVESLTEPTLYDKPEFCIDKWLGNEKLWIKGWKIIVSVRWINIFLKIIDLWCN